MSQGVYMTLCSALAGLMAIHGHGVWAAGRAGRDAVDLGVGSLVMLLALLPLLAGVFARPFPRTAMGCLVGCLIGIGWLGMVGGLVWLPLLIAAAGLLALRAPLQRA